MRGVVVAAAGLLVLPAGGLLGATAAAAAVPKKPKKPAIVAFVASPLDVPAEGGSLRLVARVRNATTCTFRRESVGIGSVRCTAGVALRIVTIAANPLQQARTLHFAVQVAGRGGKVSRTVAVTQAPAPPPLAIATTSLADASTGASYSAALGASGGTPPYTWTLASGSLPAGLTLAADGTLSGTPTAPGQFGFTVQVTDAAGRTATLQLSLAVGAPQLPVTAMTTSFNWSGYALEGSSFTSATGTFTVPTVAPTEGNPNTAEWVGIDGVTGSNLIQAGVAEDVNSGSVQTYAWWEILPAPATPIDTIAVSQGDTVSVAISEVSSGSWTISVTDVTSNQSFSTTQSYAGAGASAEWIVEAATDARTNLVLPLAPYSTPVSFTGLGWAGTPTAFRPISLVQHGVTVSVPSPFNADQTSFVVAYGSTAPAAPG